MRYLVWAAVIMVSVTFAANTATAQRKRIEQLETKMRNIETDLEVLQEFLQEQSNGIQKIRAQVEELGKLKQEIGQVDTKVGSVAELSRKLVTNFEALQKSVTANADRITAIEEQLARKKVDFTGQVRLRPEYRANHRTFNRLLTDDQNFGASHRVRVGLDVAPTDWVKARITLQDARTWGSPTLFLQKEDLGEFEDSLGNALALPEDRNRDSALRVHEAFLDVEIVKEVVAARIGRQVWNFGAGRIVGDNDWEQAGRSFDGADLTLTYENYIRADLLFAWIDERNASDGDDVYFGGVYLVSPYVEGMSIEAYLLYLSDPRDTAKRKVGTLGGRVAGRFPLHKALFYDLEGAVQFGTVTENNPGDLATVDNDHYAAMAHLELGYELPVPTAPQLSIFYELASGDGNTSPAAGTGNDLSAGWVPIFPTRHAVFGRMDLFAQVNISDIGGRLALTPVDGLLLEVLVHGMSLYDDNGQIPLGQGTGGYFVEPLDSYLGTELDLAATWVFNDNFNLMAGYGVFVPGSTFESLDERDPVVLPDEDSGQLYSYPRGDEAHWFFVQADFTF